MFHWEDGENLPKRCKISSIQCTEMTQERGGVIGITCPSEETLNTPRLYATKARRSSKPKPEPTPRTVYPEQQPQ